MNTATITPAQKKLENMANLLSLMFGVKLEITIRGLRDFTFSFEGNNDATKKAIEKYFRKNAVKVWSLYDSECDLTCVYVNS